MFDVDYENESLLPEGDYECVVKGAFVTATNGYAPREYFSVRFVVRNDVPQKYQNKVIFHAIWWRNEDKQTEDDRKIGGFSYKQIMNLCKGVGIPRGKSFKDLNELGEFMTGKCCLVHIVHDTWQGKTSAKVAWVNETKYPNCTHKFPVKNEVQPTNAAAVTEIETPEDEDLPF